jgi:hypothetical protein
MRTHLVHGVGEEGLEGAALARRLVLKAGEQRGEGRRLLALGEHLQAVVMVADVLLVDAQHRQQHVEEISWNKGRPSPAHEREGEQRATRRKSANNNTRAQATQTTFFSFEKLNEQKIQTEEDTDLRRTTEHTHSSKKGATKARVGSVEIKKNGERLPQQIFCVAQTTFCFSLTWIVFLERENGN